MSSEELHNWTENRSLEEVDKTIKNVISRIRLLNRMMLAQSGSIQDLITQYQQLEQHFGHLLLQNYVSYLCREFVEYEHKFLQLIKQFFPIIRLALNDLEPPDESKIVEFECVRMEQKCLLVETRDLVDAVRQQATQCVELKAILGFLERLQLEEECLMMQNNLQIDILKSFSRPNDEQAVFNLQRLVEEQELMLLEVRTKLKAKPPEPYVKSNYLRWNFEM